MSIQADLAEIPEKAYPAYSFKDHKGRCTVKLNKALYGCTISAKLWHDHLDKALKAFGLTLTLTMIVELQYLHLLHFFYFNFGMSSLSTILVQGLLNSPSLLNKLPGVLLKLEEGKEVALENFEKEEQDTIEKLFEIFPKLAKDYGLKLDSIRKLVIKELLNRGYVVPVKKMNDGMSLSMKKGPLLLLDLLEKFPPLKGEIGALFDTIIEKGEKKTNDNIDISGLSDDSLQTALSKLFLGLGLRRCKNEENNEYIFTYSEHRSDYKDCLQAFKYMRNVISIYEDESQRKGKRQRSDSESSASCTSDSSDDPSDSQPSKLPYPYKHASVVAGAQVVQSRADESSDDDDYGPKLTPVLTVDYTAPLGGVALLEPQLIERFIPKSEEQLQLEVSRASQRDEWMLAPGKHDPFNMSNPNNLASMMTAKKFHTGKLAKKAAEQVEAMKERARDELDPEAKAALLQSEEAMRTMREMRGPSLMEMHAEKRKEAEMTGVPVAKRSFDRDRDMARSMTQREVHQIVEQSKDLDSRFSKGFVQRS